MPNARNLDLTAWRHKFLLWGPTGTGKTHFIGTCPKPYVFDFDGSIATVVGKDVEYDYYDPKDANSVRMADSMLRRFLDGSARKDDRLKGVETVCLDSTSAYQEARTLQVQTLNNHVGQQVTQPEWGQIINGIQDMVSKITSLADRGLYHVVVTAHEQIDKDDIGGGLVCRPMVVGKNLPGWLPTKFSEVYYLGATVSGKGEISWSAQTRSDRLHNAKTRAVEALEFQEPVDFTTINTKLMQHYESVVSLVGTPTGGGNGR